MWGPKQNEMWIKTQARCCSRTSENLKFLEPIGTKPLRWTRQTALHYYIIDLCFISSYLIHIYIYIKTRLLKYILTFPATTLGMIHYFAQGKCNLMPHDFLNHSQHLPSISITEIRYIQ